MRSALRGPVWPAMVATCLVAGCAAGPTGSRAPSMPETDEALVARFRPCVGPVGPAVALPVAPAGAEAAFTGNVLPLSSTGRVADGYNHQLRLDGARSHGVIVQSGGLAGRTTVFGPFDLREGCRPPP